MNSKRKSGPIGFLVKTYPKLSETFVLEEILGLERLGVKLHIFSLNPPSDDAVHSGFDNVVANVTYLPQNYWSLASVAAQFAQALRHPWRYLNSLAFALTRGERGGLRDFLRAGVLAEKMRALNIAHVHSHFISEPTGVAELTSRLSGVSYSVSAHAKDIYLSQPSVLRRKLERAKFTVTCTCYNRNHLHAIAPKAIVQRMYHGIDLERFDGASDALKAAPPLVLSVGRLVEKKGFATLIQACLALNLKGLSFRCEIVGYGSEQKNLQDQIDSFGLGDVVVLIGKMTHAALIARYRQATLFVLPSQIAEDGDRDGIPNVLLEAMAMELPVVSTDVSGIPEVVQSGRNGLLVPPKNASALAEAIGELLVDSKLRGRMGKEGRHVVETMFDNARNLLLLRGLFEGGRRDNFVTTESSASKEYLHVG